VPPGLATFRCKNDYSDAHQIRRGSPDYLLPR
jgi:hypothetical protein